MWKGGASGGERIYKVRKRLFNTTNENTSGQWNLWVGRTDVLDGLDNQTLKFLRGSLTAPSLLRTARWYRRKPMCQCRLLLQRGCHDIGCLCLYYLQHCPCPDCHLVALLSRPSHPHSLNIKLHNTSTCQDSKTLSVIESEPSYVLHNLIPSLVLMNRNANPPTHA